MLVASSRWQGDAQRLEGSACSCWMQVAFRLWQRASLENESAPPAIGGLFAHLNTRHTSSPPGRQPLVACALSPAVGGRDPSCQALVKPADVGCLRRVAAELWS